MRKFTIILTEESFKDTMGLELKGFIKGKEYEVFAVDRNKYHIHEEEKIETVFAYKVAFGRFLD